MLRYLEQTPQVNIIKAVAQGYNYLQLNLAIDGVDEVDPKPVGIHQGRRVKIIIFSAVLYHILPL